MYINYQFLESKGYTVQDLTNLILIRQKESLYIELNILEAKLLEYAESNLVDFVKVGKTIFENVRITSTGLAFITQATTAGYDDNIGRLATKLQQMYRDVGASEDRVGNQAQIISDLIWYRDSSIFSLADIYNFFDQYTSDLSINNNINYIKGLNKIFWEARGKNIFSVHRKLSESKLYELMCEWKYNTTGEDLQAIHITNSTKDVNEFTYFNTIKNLIIPTNLDDTMYFTGSRAEDVRAKKRIIINFINKLKTKYK